MKIIRRAVSRTDATFARTLAATRTEKDKRNQQVKHSEQLYVEDLLHGRGDYQSSPQKELAVKKQLTECFHDRVKSQQIFKQH